MSWAKAGSATSEALREHTERLRQSLGGSLGPIEHENRGAASEGFIDECDEYDAFMFTTEIDGREYCVTVEDVTINEDS